MATKRKNNFENVFGTYRNDNIAKFEELNSETKLLLYSELFAWTEKKLAKRSGDTSIRGRALKFQRYFEEYLVKSSGRAPQTVFKRITNAAGYNWENGYFPDSSAIEEERLTLSKEFKADYTSEVTAENVDEQFAKLLNFGTNVNVIYDRLGTINSLVVDNPISAGNKLYQLMELTGNADSDGIRQIEACMDSYQYPLAISLADAAINSVKAEKKNQEAVEEVLYGSARETAGENKRGLDFEEVDKTPTLEEQLERSFVLFNKYAHIARAVENGQDKLGTYSKLATDLRNFVREYNNQYLWLKQGLENAKKEGNANFLTNNPNINSSNVARFVHLIESAEQALTSAGVDLDNITTDKSGRPDVKRLTEEMEKLTVRKAGPRKPQTREDFLREGAKVYERLQGIVADGREYHQGDRKLLRNFDVAKDVVGAYKDVWKKIELGKVDELSDSDIERFYDVAMNASNRIMSDAPVSTNPAPTNGRANPKADSSNPTSPVPVQPVAPAPVRTPNNKKEENPVVSADADNNRREVIPAPEVTIENWTPQGQMGSFKLNEGSPIVVGVKEPNKSKNESVSKPSGSTSGTLKLSQIYNNPNIGRAMAIFTKLRDMLFLFRNMEKKGAKLPANIKAFYDKYNFELRNNSAFFTDISDDFAHGKNGIKMSPEQLASVQDNMNIFVDNMMEVDKEFKERELNLDNLVEYKKGKKAGEEIPVFNDEEFQKLIRSYNENPLYIQEDVPVINPIGGATGIVSDNNASATPDGNGRQSQSTSRRTSAQPTGAPAGQSGSASTVSNPATANSNEQPQRGSVNPQSPANPQQTSVNPQPAPTVGSNPQPTNVGNGGGSNNKADSTEEETLDFTPTKRKISNNSNKQSTSANKSQKSASANTSADGESQDNEQKQEMPKVKRDGFFKRLGKWIARRPVLTATILLAVVVAPVAGAISSTILPSVVLWGTVGVLLGNGVKAIVKGVVPQYKRFILNYDIDKRRRRLEVAQEKSRQIMKDVDSILSDRKKTREDIRNYANIENVKKPKKEKFNLKDMEAFAQDKKEAKKQLKAKKKADAERVAEEMKDYLAIKKAKDAVDKVGKVTNQKLQLKRSELDLTGLDERQIREIVRLGVELGAQEKRVNKEKSKIDKKFKKVIKHDGKKLDAGYLEKDCELQREINKSESITDKRAKALAEDVKDMKVPKIMNTKLGRQIDGAINGGYSKRTETVEKQIVKTETKVASMIDSYIEKGDVREALDYIADDMLGNNGVANETYIAKVKDSVGNAGVQYIRAKYMELKAGDTDTRASETILQEIEGSGSKKQSDKAMAELYGEYYYRQGMSDAQVAEAIKKLKPDVQATIKASYSATKDIDERLM